MLTLWSFVLPLLTLQFSRAMWKLHLRQDPATDAIIFPSIKVTSSRNVVAHECGLSRDMCFVSRRVPALFRCHA